MHHLGFVLTLYVAAVAQFGLAGGMTLGPAAPHFLFLAALMAALVDATWAGLAWAAAAGLVSDCLAGGPLGVDVLPAVWIGLLARRWLRSRESHSPPALAAVCGVAVFSALLFSQTLRLILTGRQCDHAALMLLVTATALYSAGVALIVLLGRAAARRALSPITNRRP